jgi:peptide/nickel transport system substrate-binding protein
MLATAKPLRPMTPKRRSALPNTPRSRGYVFPDTPEFLEQAFGLGLVQVCPDVAEKLLVKNGFSKNADGKWLLPDGKPWKISFMCGTVLSNHDARNAAAAVQQWKKFGIDAEMYSTRKWRWFGSHRRL